MKSIIERNAKIPATILYRVGIIDGKPQYGNSTPCLCMLFDFTRADHDNFGTIDTSSGLATKKVMVPPISGGVDTTCKIVIDGKENIIKGVKTLRNMKCIIIGYTLAI